MAYIMTKLCTVECMKPQKTRSRPDYTKLEIHVSDNPAAFPPTSGRDVESLLNFIRENRDGVIPKILQDFIKDHPHLVSRILLCGDHRMTDAATFTVRFFQGLECNSVRWVSFLSCHLNDALLTKLAPSLGSLSHLETLNLNMNDIGDSGCEALANVLLRDPRSSMRTLSLLCNPISKTGAIAIANALNENSRLEHLALHWHPCGDDEPIRCLSRALCDESTADTMNSSNHVLACLALNGGPLPEHLASLLEINRNTKNKAHAGMKKILKHYEYFEMETFFKGWDLELLPLVVDWFERAVFIESDDARLVIRKLDAINQFLWAKPHCFGQLGGRVKIGLQDFELECGADEIEPVDINQAAPGWVSKA